WSGNPAFSIKEIPRDSCSSTRLGTHRYSGDDSQSGRGTQANTYSDRTRSQGASSNTGEGSPERRLNRRQLYGRHAVDSGAEVLGTITRKRREGGIDLGDGGSPAIQSWEHASAIDRKVEAEAELRATTRADPTFAEAWYNLSNLLDEQGRSEAPIDCLRRALQAAPDYADAMFNLALLLERGSRHKEAAEYWRQYLANDAQSEWAARARRSLKFCEL